MGDRRCEELIWVEDYVTDGHYRPIKGCAAGSTIVTVHYASQNTNTKGNTKCPRGLQALTTNTPRTHGGIPIVCNEAWALRDQSLHQNILKLVNDDFV